MSSSDSPTSQQQPDSEVFDLFVRMRIGEVSHDDRRLFANWVKENPESMRMYNKLETLWAELGEQTTRMTPHQMQQQLGDLQPDAPISDDTNQSRSWLPGKAWSIAAALVLSVAALITTTLFSNDPDLYQTQLAERMVVNLEDGSTVHLNSQTRIEVSYSGAQRLIQLLSGEALFEVAHDPQRKFLVHTELGSVQAIGTKFNIDTSSELIQVTVIEGTIAVAPLDSSEPSENLQVATLGEAVSIVESGNISKRRLPGNAEDVIAWTRGKLIFSGESLSQVLKKANLHSHQRITVKDQRLMQLPVYGIFNTGDTLGLIAALETALPIRPIEVSDNLTLLSYHE